MPQPQGEPLAPSTPHDLGERLARLESRLAHSERRLAGVLEFLLWCGIALPLTFVILKLDRPRGGYWPHLGDSAHVFASGFIALLALRLSRRILSGILRSPRAHYLVSLAVVFSVGASLEVLQAFTQGDPSLKDLARDLLGGCAGLAVALSFDPWVMSHMRRRRLSNTARLLGLGFLALGLAPTLRSLYRTRCYHQLFPTLADFEEDWQRRFVDPGDSTHLEFVPRPSGFATAEGQVAKVVFGTDKYPGIEFSEPASNWSSYQTLTFEVFSPAATPVDLNLRIDQTDRDSNYAGRYNGSRQVLPGSQTIRVPLAEVRAGPAGEPLDLRRIKVMILFLSQPSQPVTLYFDRFRLEQ